MKQVNYLIDPKSNEFKPIRGTASEIKTDAEYLEAAAKAVEALEEVGKELEAFTDDFDIRSAYNQLCRAYNKLKMKGEIA